jgi:hypothetical protein
MHIIGGDAHESVQRYVLGLAGYLVGIGARVYAAYDPDALRGGADHPWVCGLRGLGAGAYPLKVRDSALPAAALTLREMCRRLGVDVVHTHAMGDFSAACLARMSGGGFVHVYTLHAKSAAPAPEIAYETAYDAARASAAATAAAASASADWAAASSLSGDGANGAAATARVIGAAAKAVGASLAAKAAGAAAAARALGTGGARGKPLGMGGFGTGGSGSAPSGGGLRGADSPREGRGRRRGLPAGIARRLLSGACDEIVAGSLHAAAGLPGGLAAKANVSLIRAGVASPAGAAAEAGRSGASGRAGASNRAGAHRAIGTSGMSATGMGDAPSGAGAANGKGAAGQIGAFTVLMIVDSDARGFKNWLASDLFVELAARVGSAYGGEPGDYAGCRFRILNNGNLTDNQYMEIMEKISGMGLADRVTLETGASPGWPPRPEQAQLCLYHSEGRYFPYPAVEAMASGIPALTDDRELAERMATRLGRLGCLADFENPEEAAPAILALMRDRALYERAGRLSRAAAASLYPFDGMASAVHNIYVRGLRI